VPLRSKARLLGNCKQAIIGLASDIALPIHYYETMQPGQLLCDRYRIEKALARGGFGETFLAVDTHLPSQPQVVVKLLKPIYNDPATLQVAQRLFNMEAETLEQLGKGNDRIPSLYAYFELKGEFYLVQEYIEGETLTAELQERKISESDTIAILKEILTGLSSIHRESKIHRDLKPDNIIRRDRDRKLVLIDFGAVKQVRTATTNLNLVSRTINIGTPGYMPNEQGMGAPKLASDIYAVGAIAIQCLTGSAPHLLFDEDSLKIEWQHLCQVNRDFTAVLNQMLAPDYRQRYANATEALQAIESLIPPSPPQISSTPKPIHSPVISTVPTKPASSYSPPQPVKRPVNQGRKPPSSESIQQTVKKQVKTLFLRWIDRRNFLKWLGLGVIGFWSLNVVLLVLSQIIKNLLYFNKYGSISKDINSAKNIPKLAKIRFQSVKLDLQGTVVDRPTGSAEIFTEDLGNGVKLTMVKIPAGKFLMGSPENERERNNDESPQHQVSVPEFYLGQMLVTQAQWTAIMGNNPSNFNENDKLPVEQVSWLDAMDFCQKLSQQTGRIYRLPSEAEWEYACRAGTTSPFAFGETITPSVVNYDGNYPYGKAAKGDARGKTTPVGSFPPNLFGLYDLHGNLWEWCLDEWVDSSYNGAPTDGSARGDVSSGDDEKRCRLRGGSWRFFASSCRSALRYDNTASGRYDVIGFRVLSAPSRTS
jgi:eukaryotic-like serine/threonine-protein kinase